MTGREPLPWPMEPGYDSRPTRTVLFVKPDLIVVYDQPAAREFIQADGSVVEKIWVSSRNSV